MKVLTVDPMSPTILHQIFDSPHLPVSLRKHYQQ